MQPNRFRMLALAAAIASITSLAHAQAGSASKWWWESYNGSGSVQLKSPGTVSATRNPTGDAAQPATTAATQPPTVIIKNPRGYPTALAGGGNAAVNSRRLWGAQIAVAVRALNKLAVAV